MTIDHTTAPMISEAHGVRMIVWPAFTYVEHIDPEAPICIDEGARHLGKAVPGVAVPFKTRRGDEVHKHFGICEGDEGQPLAYGKATSVTAAPSEHVSLAAAHVGHLVEYKGRRYRIRATSNDNIALDPVD